MKIRHTALAPITLLGVLMVGASCPAVLRSQASPSDSDSWSAAVDGLRGRLIVSAVQGRDRPQVRIDLELQNLRDVLGPLEIPWRDPPSTIVLLTVEDEAGTAVSRLSPGGNEHTVPHYSLQIPMGSTIRMTLAPAAYEYLPDGRVLLRPFTFVGWEVPARPAPHYLRGTLTPRAPDAASVRPWTRTLALPRVRLP